VSATLALGRIREKEAGALADVEAAVVSGDPLKVDMTDLAAVAGAVTS
jgi:hypothetical protein